jgi:hypothetical protein
MIDRNTSGIREVLFQELESLRANETTPQRACAVAKLCAQIVQSARLDIDYQRFVSADGGADNVTALRATRLVA